MQYKTKFQEALAQFEQDFKTLICDALTTLIADYATFSLTRSGECGAKIKCIVFDNAFIIEHTLGEQQIIVYHEEQVLAGLKKISFEIPATAKAKELRNALDALSLTLHKMDLLNFASEVFDYKGAATAKIKIAEQKKYVEQHRADTIRFQTINKQKGEAQQYLHTLGIFEDVASFLSRGDLQSAIAMIKAARKKKGQQVPPDEKIKEFLKMAFG